MRDRILQGPPFSAEERARHPELLRGRRSRAGAAGPAYRSDHPTAARARACFAPSFSGRWRSRSGAAFRSTCRCSPACATTGTSMRLDLVTEMDRPFGIYEIVDGRPHWRKQRFADYVRRAPHDAGLTHEDGTLDERDQTFREMAGQYPQIEPLRELRYSLSKLRLNDLAVGQRRSQPHAVVGLRHQDRAQRAEQLAITCSARRSGFGS